MEYLLRDDREPHQIRIFLHVGAESTAVELAVSCTCLVRDHKSALLVRETIPAEEALRVWKAHRTAAEQSRADWEAKKAIFLHRSGESPPPH